LNRIGYTQDSSATTMYSATDDQWKGYLWKPHVNTRLVKKKIPLIFNMAILAKCNPSNNAMSVTTAHS